ncbi:hypothetical protein AB1Y20_012746 [Prymnesium parvum]
MASREDDTIWVPVTINLPMGLVKGWTHTPNCAPISIVFGPYSIILLAQTANTVLVPVLPFLVKDVGASAISYGMLQSTLWTSQTVLAPVLGWLSDRLGRRPVICISLLISALGNALLAVSNSVGMMAAARIISGLGFQIALFRAYFADRPKEQRTGSFGLIGVVQGFALFGGPSIGGFASHWGGRRMAPWMAAALCLAAALITIMWHPIEEVGVRRGASGELTGEALQKHQETHKEVNGVKLVKLDLAEGDTRSEASSQPSSAQHGWRAWRLCVCMRKTYKLSIWLGKHGLYPLLLLNFFFRFAFAAYKSVFAFFCMEALGYGTAEVGYLLSGMGLAGMGVQGVLVRIVVAACGEERTLAISMAATSLGFVALSMTTGLEMLIPALGIIAIGYGLAVPSLSTLFSLVPVEQGIMQGIAGAIDRFGQAFGPLVGGAALHLLGEAGLMRYTGLALALISSVCLLFIGDGCVSWIRNSCMRSLGGGYAPLDQSQGDIDQADELEMADVPDSPSKLSDIEAHSNGEINGSPQNMNGSQLQPVAPK